MSDNKKYVVAIVVFNIVWVSIMAFGVYALTRNDSVKSDALSQLSQSAPASELLNSTNRYDGSDRTVLTTPDSQQGQSAMRYFIIGDINISIENATIDDGTEVVRDELKAFPRYNLAGLKKVIFNETPLDEKGLHYDMYYYPNGTILIRPGLQLERNIYAQKFNHELGHHVIARDLLGTTDFKKLEQLHENRSLENFISPYAMTSALEDGAETISAYSGNTRLLSRIAAKNKIMQEKFLIVAKRFCLENACIAYVPMEGYEENLSPYDYNGKNRNSKGFYTGFIIRVNLTIKNVGDFSEFAEKLNSK